MSAFDTVDDFLLANHRLRLEDVLCEGCLMGRLSVALGDAMKILPRLVGSTVEEDGGVANVYDGILVLDGVCYRFRRHVFVACRGPHILSYITTFPALGPHARCALSVH